MIYAVKDNKRYQVGEDAAQQEDFLSRGYDLTDETGKVIRHSPVKSVPYAKYAALLEENVRLKEMLPLGSEADEGSDSPARAPRRK